MIAKQILDKLAVHVYVLKLNVMPEGIQGSSDLNLSPLFAWYFFLSYRPQLDYY
jgi:hypothetical protein